MTPYEEAEQFIAVEAVRLSEAENIPYSDALCMVQFLLAEKLIKYEQETRD